MQIGNINTNDQVFIVAEIGNNHEGDFSLAKDMIGLAAEAGVDAIKFQTFRPEHFVSKDDVTRIEQLRRFQLTFEQFSSLAEIAQKHNLVFFSTLFDFESAIFLNTIQPLFKISSGDNTFYPLINLIAGFGKPTILSTGLAELNLLNSIYSFWIERSTPEKLALLHCVSSYPTPFEQANLSAIQRIKRQFPDVTVGYSDHTLGNKASTLAVACGARIIEKHFTHNKNHSEFRDHKISADPKEMKELVEAVNEISAYLGKEDKFVQGVEKKSKEAMRRSIAAANDLQSGTEITEDNLTWVRPGSGLPPGDERQVIGRRTKSNLKKGEIIMPKNLK